MSSQTPFIIVAVATLLVMTGYAFADMTIIGTDPAADMKTKVDTINEMSKDLSCAEDKDCKSIGFGDKPCGGFVSYKIYSTKTVNESNFRDLVNQYNEWDKEQNRENGMASTCDMVMEPAVACVQGQCAAMNIGTNSPVAQ